MTAVVRACLVDVYDTIFESLFVPRMTALVEPLGISVEDWLAELEKIRARPGPGQADHRRRRSTGRCAASASSRPTAWSTTCRGATRSSPAPTSGCATTRCRS